MKSDEYLDKCGLKKILDEFYQNGDPTQKIMYNADDLCFIHNLVRKRKPFTTLEFGVGFSTITISHALQLNKTEFENLSEQPKLRNTKMFKHYVVDTNQFWIDNTKSNFPLDLIKFVEFHQCDAYIRCLSDFQLCSLYNKLPNIVPEFIYLDGPDPKDIKGEINGLDFKCPERTVISADILLMESTFLPGTFILIDGRTNNARFLKNNLKRHYSFHWDQKKDKTTLELIEEQIGPHNVIGSELY